jgi:soluble lytic murein transglycosylase-like protein
MFRSATQPERHVRDVILSLSEFFRRRCARSFALLAICFITTTQAGVARADAQQDPEIRNVVAQALKESSCFDDRFEREVWMKAMEPRLRKLVKDLQERSDILEQVHCQAKRLQLPPALLMAVMDVESRFDRWAVSPVGAVGLMQVMPFWPRQLGMTNAELVQIPQNIHMGAAILKFYLDREKGDYTRALARYNGSVGRRDYSDLVLERLGNRWNYR